MSSLCVFRTHRTAKYSTIGLYCVEDNRISWESKGLHTYLISRPKQWKVHLSELLKRSTNGRHSLRSCFRELNEFGYVEWTQVFDEKHKFVEMKYDVYEKSNQDVIIRNAQKQSQKSDANKEKTSHHPQAGFPHADFPYDEKPACGKSVGGKSTPNNNNSINNQKDNNNQGSNQEAPKNGAQKASPPVSPSSDGNDQKQIPTRYTSEWNMWKAEQAELIYEEHFQRRPFFNGKDLDAFCRLRGDGATVAQITKCYEEFCLTENSYYAKRGYAFHVFAEDFNAFGNEKMKNIIAKDVRGGPNKIGSPKPNVVVEDLGELTLRRFGLA